MKWVAAIVLVCLLIVPVWGQDAPRSVFINNFGGFGAALPTDLPAGAAVNVTNFDFAYDRSLDGSGLGLQLRPGFARLAESPGVGLLGGIYQWTKPGATPLIMASFGTDLYYYGTSTGRWERVFSSPLVDTCECHNGSDSVFVIRRKQWWGLSTQKYVTINLAGSPHTVRRILGDSLVIVTAAYSGGNHDTVQCDLVGTGSMTEVTPFTSATEIKRGLMYEDTLHIMTAHEHVKYGGSMSAQLTAPINMTAISAWDPITLTFTLSGANPNAPTNWVMVGPTKNYDLNLAFWPVSYTTNSVTLRADSNIYAVLANNSSSTWHVRTLGSTTYTPLSPLKIDAVTRDSVFLYETLIETRTQFMTLDRLTSDTCRANTAGSCNPYEDSLSLLYGREYKFYRQYYKYKWTVTSTTTTGVPESWPADSLDYMPVTYKSDSAHWNIGSYRRQIPAYVDVSGGNGRFHLATIGSAGNGTYVTSIRIDSLPWVAANYYNPTPYMRGNWYRNGTWTQQYNVNGLCGCYVQRFPDTLAHGWWDTCGSSGFYPCWVDSGFTASYRRTIVSAAPSLTPPAIVNDYAQTAFMVDDSLLMYKLDRDAISSVAVSMPRDTAQHFPIAVQMMEQFWYAGSPYEPNKVIWSATYDPDSVIPKSGTSTNFQYVYNGDGQTITSLWNEQNILYVGMPTTIFSMPVSRETIRPTGLYQTGSAVGPVSQEALTRGPDGWYFVATNGLYRFTGNESELVSAAVSTFWRDSVDRSNIAVAVVVYDQADDRILVSVPLQGQSTNGTTLSYDLRTRMWSRYTQSGSTTSVFGYGGGTPQVYFGSPDRADGGVYYIENMSHLDTGAAMIAGWKTPWIRMSETIGSQVQLFEWFLESRRNESGKIALSVFVDGSDMASFVDTTVVGNGTWKTERMGFPVALQGERFQFLVQSLDATKCDVSGLRIDYVPAGVSPW